MDEDLDVDGRVNLLEEDDGADKTLESVEVFVLGVDDEDDGADSSEDAVDVREGVVVDMRREVPDLKVHERANRCC